MSQTKASEKISQWYQCQSNQVLEHFNTSKEGLSSSDSSLRLKKYGFNRLPPPKKIGFIARLLLQFNNVLIYVLLGAAAITGLLQHWVDTGVILGVVIINALIGVIQEGKAEKALAAIRAMLSPSAMVKRDGKRLTLPAEQLVPGDIVFLQSGDKVPTDLRLLTVKNLKVDESVLTGESVPVGKTVDPIATEVALGDRACMAYSGTLVTYGQAVGVVIATGKDTEIGRISELLGQVKLPVTPLLRNIARFSRWLTATIIMVAGLAFMYGIGLRDYLPAEMFLVTVSLAVAAIPEGLPAIISITLALGVQRMAKRNAIIRRLPAVETLGAVTVICSDKTGTLTCNEMTAQSIVMSNQSIEVSGVGYGPKGEFTDEGKPKDVAADPALRELVQTALLCNDAVLEQRDDGWRLHGDPTEGALVTLAMKAKLDPASLREKLSRIDVIPFESEHCFMATLHREPASQGVVCVKGAVERLLTMCEYQRHGNTDVPLDPTYWEQQTHALARRGQRVLGIAIKRDFSKDELSHEDVTSGLVLLGVVGMSDPPRAEAIAAVAKCQSAGITVKMITGDHAITAQAIAEQMKLSHTSTVLTGQDIDAASDDELCDIVMNVDVFARTSPEHKLRLIQALQANGAVVAMTGDGVNDTPALKRADVGVAMGGNKGTEVAKEAAEMVLTDDNFTSIEHAVEEGRAVYDNIKKSILFILPTNGGQAFIVLLALLFGYVLPITPVQILWINMITAVTLALSLAFEPPEKDVMMRVPRDPDEPLVSHFLLWRIIFVSLILVAGTSSLFLWGMGHGDIDYARTVAVNTLVMFEVFYLLSSRYIHASVLSKEGLLGNKYVLLAIVLVVFFQLLFTYTPKMQYLFATKPIDLIAWVWIVLLGSSVFFLVEFEKYCWHCYERFKLKKQHERQGELNG